MGSLLQQPQLDQHIRKLLHALLHAIKKFLPAEQQAMLNQVRCVRPRRLS